MNASRRRAFDARTGRLPRDMRSVDAAGSPAASAYELLLPRLVQLRAAIAADERTVRPLDQVRRDHAALDDALNDAVARAFAADALAAPTPDGVSSWAAEGLARSGERELALFAAGDVIGVRQIQTATRETQ